MGYRQPNASLTGPGVNPWDPTRWSGGSSNGSASSVCAGLVPFAIGSETWGSILGPANHCGLAGLRPTFGRVSRHGAMVLSWSLDKIGPLCLTPDDCGLVLEAIAGPDAADPSTTDRPFRYEPGPLRRRLRLGVIRGVAEGAEAETRRNFEAALGTLGAVASIEDVTVPALPYEDIARTILFAEAASAFEDLIESGRIGELTAPEDRYTPYSRLTVLAKDYIRALRLRGEIATEIDRAMRGFDAWLGPSRPVPSSRLDEEFRSAIGGATKDLMGAIGNVAGLPAISVPDGFTENGVPTGIQFMGRAYDENVILAAAGAYQGLTDWHLRRPPGTLP
jgi:aspartyl-tRNA(Asn)/glutamyl-tRNA(Gln) amidotransferase subunit A